MKPASLILAGAILAASSVFADTQPASTSPATAPATAQQIFAPRVLVIPPNVLNVPASQQWIGTGIAEMLVADLGRSGLLTPVAYQGQTIIEDNAAAIRVAKAANTLYVIRGTAQVVGPNVRITAQLIDTQTGDTVQTAMVTGGTADLLKLEDDLSAQLRGTTTAGSVPAPAPLATAVPTPTAAPSMAAATPAAAQAPVPQIIVIQQAPASNGVPTGPTYYQPSYNPPVYPDYYPDLTYFPYPYTFPYFVTILPGHEHDHDGHGGRGGDHSPGAGQDDGGNGGNDHPHLVSAPVSGPTALPLPTPGGLPLPTNVGLPLPSNGPLPLAHAPIAPTVVRPVSAPISAPGGNSPRPPQSSTAGIMRNSR